jgi:hypothetical protein
MKRFLCHPLRRWLLFLPVMLFLTSLTSSPALGKPLDTTIHLSPSSGFLPINEEFEVEVWVSNVTDLYGLDIQLAFDPTRFEIIDANPAVAGVQIIPRNDLLSPDLVVKNVADNTQGSIWYAVTQLNPTPAVSGSGAVFAFKLRPLKPGSGEFSFDSFKLASRDGEVIPATAMPAT